MSLRQILRKSSLFEEQKPNIYTHTAEMLLNRHKERIVFWTTCRIDAENIRQIITKNWGDNSFKIGDPQPKYTAQSETKRFLQM